MFPEWFRKRSYAHFDVPVGLDFIQQTQYPPFVARHSFSPLIHFLKETKRYKPGNPATGLKSRVVIKPRPIMYASHRDACILSYYNSILMRRLERFYQINDIGDNVIAYRKLGKSNYHFSSEALQFASNNYPCMILAYDVTKFFDTLNHSLLKVRLKHALETAELPADWYAVFRHVTRFSYVDYEHLRAHPTFGSRIVERNRRPIATIAELKREKISITANKSGIGIPQGTPISSALANLYLIQFDLEMAAHAREVGGYYRRYSDDILFICQEIEADAAEDHIETVLKRENLEISHNKTEKTLFHPKSQGAAQYLGFRLHPAGASIRPSSMSKQMRKMKWAVKRTHLKGKNAIAAGYATKVFTKKLHKRFTKLPIRNFISYGGRSAAEFRSPQVERQLKRLEKKFHQLIEGYKSSPP